MAALDIRSGECSAILGRAVILATGGAGKCFPFTTNGNIKTGDGMALAYRAGVPSRTWSSSSTTRPACRARAS